MNSSDDVQRLWQQDDSRMEDHSMWMRLVQEKRTGFDELVRAENQAWYLVALSIGPLVTWATWKARYPWVHVGYGLMAATIALGTIGTWIAQRKGLAENDRSLREHLEALIDSYDQRIRYLRNGSLWASPMLFGGVLAVIMGIPGNLRNTVAWVFAGFLLAGIVGGQWLIYKRARAPICRKRLEAVHLLQELTGEGHDTR
jgi:hypothetical protein